MDSFINIIKMQKFGKNIPLEIAKLSIANIKLKQNLLPQIPNEFGEFLKNFNGLSNEGSLVFGAYMDSTLFIDLLKFNINFFKGNKSNWLILGFDECFYFVYDSEKIQYHIVDKDTFEPEITSSNIFEPISFLLRLEQ